VAGKEVPDVQHAIKKNKMSTLYDFKEGNAFVLVPQGKKLSPRNNISLSIRPETFIDAGKLGYLTGKAKEAYDVLRNKLSLKETT